jgi:acetyl-CoA carboxylase biotin carboxyl carrier protein
MNPEDMKELKELIEFLKENQIGEFDLDRGDLKVRIKFAQESTSAADLAGLTRLLNASTGAVQSPQPAMVAAPPAITPTQAPPAEEAAAVDENAGLHIVKSPIVGTFYESPSPGTPAFVQAGDQVDNGQVLCIVEAMKLMNEIESDAAGEIVKRLVANGQPVEYGQPLFALRLR